MLGSISGYSFSAYFIHAGQHDVNSGSFPPFECLGKDIRPEAVLADATVTDKDYRREVEKLRACGKIVISLLPGERPLAAAERLL